MPTQMTNRRQSNIWKPLLSPLSSLFMPTAVLMCPPTFFDVSEPKNPHMGTPIDRVRAYRQWEDLRRTMEDLGLKIEIIDPVQNIEDMVFAANQVFVGDHQGIGKFIVPSRMRYASRQREVEHYVDWFRRHGYRVLEVDLQVDYLEGHGDLLWHPGSSTIWAGHGFRSTCGGVERFAVKMRELGFSVTPLQLADPYFYHLDTCFCPLNHDAVLIYPAAFSPSSLPAIREGFRRVHEVSRDEAMQFIPNGVVANGRFLTPRLTENLARILSQESLTPIVVDTSEFEKSGGSVFCMKTFLD